MNFKQVIKSASEGTAGLYDPGWEHTDEEPKLFIKANKVYMGYDLDPKEVAKAAWAKDPFASIAISEWTQGQMIVVVGDWYYDRPLDPEKGRWYILENGDLNLL